MSELIPQTVRARLRQVDESRGNLVVITGAGVSAESGIPTFRGQDGYWTVGSTEYQPQDMGTLAMFREHPADVWAWYLYRRGVCHRAEPNAGHLALIEIENRFSDRFRLITQNIDGLHLRAGSTPQRTYQVHGNLDYARCAGGCVRDPWLINKSIRLNRKRGDAVADDELPHLKCDACGGWARPHILWFDELYDEKHYRYHSSLHAASKAHALLVAGTSGATNLPLQMGRQSADAAAYIVDVNLEANPFSRLAQSTGGVWLMGESSEMLPAIADLLPA